MFVQSENSGGLKTLVLSSLILFESAVALVAATSSYEIVDLGTLGGDFSSATAINQSGQEIFFSLDLPPILLFPHRTSNDEFQFHIADGSEPSSVDAYRIESSTNLTNWRLVTNLNQLIFPGPGRVFVDRTPATDPRRFYRAIVTQF